MGCDARSWTSRSTNARQTTTKKTNDIDGRTFVDLTLATTANSLLSRIAFAQTAQKAKNVVPTTAGVTA